MKEGAGTTYHCLPPLKKYCKRLNYGSDYQHTGWTQNGLVKTLFDGA